VRVLAAVAFALLFAVVAVSVESIAKAASSDGAIVFGKLGFQLYTSRKFPPVEDQLQTLADLGYGSVEFQVTDLEDPRAFKAKLDEFGLASPTGHFAFDRLRNDIETCLTLADLFEIRLIVAPYLGSSQRPTDADGWRALGRELEGIAQAVARHGLAFGWHSHDFEFAALPDGRYPLDLMFGEAPSLLWQADIGWIERAGQDPLPWLEKYRDRIRAVHLKDVARGPAATEEGGWADLGDGRVDWARHLPVLASADVIVYIAEHDDPSDYVRFAKSARREVSSW
jgi:sugar phosphate isomerase/epimerase